MNTLFTSQILGASASRTDVTLPESYGEMVADLDAVQAYNDSCKDLDILDASFGSLENSAEAMGGIETALQAMVDTEQHLTPETFDVLLAGVAGTVGDASVVFQDAGNLSCESTSGARKTTGYALLASGDNFLKRIWDGIKELVAKGVKFLKDFWQNTFGVVGTLKKRAKAIEDKEKDSRAEYVKGATFKLTGRDVKSLSNGATAPKTTDLTADNLKVIIEGLSANVEHLDKGDSKITSAAKDLAKVVSDLAQGKTQTTLDAYNTEVAAFGGLVANNIVTNAKATPVPVTGLASKLKSNQKALSYGTVIGGKILGVIVDDKAADDKLAKLLMPRVVDATENDPKDVTDVPALDAAGIRQVCSTVVRFAEDVEKYTKDIKVDAKILDSFDDAYKKMQEAMVKDAKEDDDKGAVSAVIDRALARRVFSNIRSVATNIQKPKTDLIRAYIAAAHGALTIAKDSHETYEEPDRS